MCLLYQRLPRGSSLEYAEGQLFGKPGIFPQQPHTTRIFVDNIFKIHTPSTLWHMQLLLMLRNFALLVL